ALSGAPPPRVLGLGEESRRRPARRPPRARKSLRRRLLPKTLNRGQTPLSSPRKPGTDSAFFSAERGVCPRFLFWRISQKNEGRKGEGPGRPRGAAPDPGHPEPGDRLAARAARRDARREGAHERARPAR